MHHYRQKTTTVFIAALCLVAVSGCKDNAPQTREANLEMSQVQGVRFDDPSPVGTLDPTTPAVATPAPVTYTPAEAAPPAVALATAEDVPDNIALIPSATPATVTPTPYATPLASELAAVALPSDPAAFAPISFKTLSGYKYVEPVPSEGERPEDVEARRQTDQIPAEVKSLDGKKAIVEGWMVPMEVSDDGSVKSFILVNTQPQCCFGDMQAMNEWVDVMMMPGSNAEFNVDAPIKVFGQLEIGEKTEDGFVLSIYRMKANRVEL